MTKRITADHVKLKRAYEPAAANDGTRILIDRLWPRGAKKADAAIDQWVKDIAPSTALRKWFGHNPDRWAEPPDRWAELPDRWAEFRLRYAAEVHQHPEQLSTLRTPTRQHPITLVFSAHDELHNDAVALRDFLLGRNTKRKADATHR